MKQKKTDNELIAEFIGFIPRQSTRYGRMWKHPYLAGEFGETHGMKFLYHSSWNALMPVVEKINTITVDKYGQMGVMITPNSCVIGNLPEEELFARYIDIGESLITVTYESVLNFIKWYNSQKP